MIFYNYYYLVYKISSDDTLWIVDESEDFQTLQDIIGHYQSNVDQYLIIKTKHSRFKIISIHNSNFKRFKIFKLHQKSKIIYKT
jgi:molybdopterin-guanine dinucleotide biosynthesis protein